VVVAEDAAKVLVLTLLVADVDRPEAGEMRVVGAPVAVKEVADLHVVGKLVAAVVALVVGDVLVVGELVTVDV
jgi:hypothetical protein